MLLSLPNPSKTGRLSVLAVACAVNILLAWLLVAILAPAKPAEPVNRAPEFYFVQRTENQQEKPKPVKPLQTTQSPSAAPSRPKLVDFSLSTSVTDFALPDIQFDPEVTIDIRPDYQFEFTAEKPGTGGMVMSRIPTAKPTLQVKPQYPPKAKRKGIEGWVVLDVLLDTQGIPQDYRVIEEQPAGVFRQVSVKAVMRWRFVPPETDLQWQRTRVNFELKKNNG